VKFHPAVHRKGFQELHSSFIQLLEPASSDDCHQVSDQINLRINKKAAKIFLWRIARRECRALESSLENMARSSESQVT